MDLDSIAVIFGIIFWLAVMVWIARFLFDAGQEIRWRRRQRRRSSSAS